MKSAAAKTTPSRHDQTPVWGAIGMDLLGTTWRMIVPVLLFSIFGLMADRHFGTGPWITLAAVVVGFIFAAVLVKQQIAKIEREDR